MMTEPFRADQPAVGVIGGSGFYELPGLTDLREVPVDTPFGAPSDALRVGRLGDTRVVFLARHGKNHALLPHEVNARANMYAFKMAGVRQILSISAVGSLREHIAPGEPVFPLQFIDRTLDRPRTFFGNGVIAHIAFADPICTALSSIMASSAESASSGRIHRGGTYVCIEGPQFSTRAESELWRQWGADVVGMTNLPEARLAREAEMCYATLALPSDYDCWRADDAHVTAIDVFETLKRSVEKAKRIVATTLKALDPGRPCACQTALDMGLVTSKDAIPAPTLERLHALLKRRLSL